METHSSPAAASAKPLAPTANAPCEPVEAGRLPSLPQWADCLAGRLLLSEILADPPEVRTYTNGLGGKSDEFAGVPAARLRRLFDKGSAEICKREMAAYRSGQPYAHITAELQAYFLQERPDALIGRLMGERL